MADEMTSVDPFAILRALNESGMPQAKSLTGAFEADYEPMGPSQAGGPGFDKEGNPIPKNAFQKGFLKGVDRLSFLAMLSDALIGISGGEPQGLTRQVVNIREQQADRAARLQEAAADRQLRRDIDAAALADRAIDRKETRDARQVAMDHDKDMAQYRAGLEFENLKKRVQLENEALETRALGDADAQANADLWQGVSELQDLRIPPYLTPQATLRDPNLREELRRLVAPHKMRGILSRIEAQQGAKAAERSREVLGRLRQAEVAWRSGVRMMSPEEQQLTGNFEGTAPILDATGKPRGSIGDLAAQDVATQGPDTLNDPEAYRQAKFAFVNDAWNDFLLRNGGAYQMLDEEIQAQEKGRIVGQLALLYDQAAQDFLVEFQKEQAAAEIIRQEEERARRRLKRSDKAPRGTGLGLIPRLD